MELNIREYRCRQECIPYSDVLCFHGIIMNLTIGSTISTACAALHRGNTFFQHPSRALQDEPEQACLCSSIATNVRYAMFVCCHSPVNGFSFVTRIPTSSDVRKTLFIDACNITTSPCFTGRWKCSPSTDAVIYSVRVPRCGNRGSDIYPMHQSSTEKVP